MSSAEGIKIIVTMIGLDGHTTGAETVCMILRDAGMEVVYLGCNKTPEMIVAAAIQEDVDVVGISSHASNYEQIERVIALLRQKGFGNVPVICGGNIPRSRIQMLKDNGVVEIFPPGSSGEHIVDSIVGIVRRAAVTVPMP
jgi:methylmalonyl-CoA mutase C-terminal domain/subunit